MASRKPTNPQSPGNFSVESEKVEINYTVTSNVTQEVVVITRDKIELCLIKHLKFMERKYSWTGPLGVAVSTITAIYTSTFKDAFHVTAATWKSMFGLVAIGSLVLFAYLFWKGIGAKSIEQIIDEMKKNSAKTEEITKT